MSTTRLHIQTFDFKAGNPVVVDIVTFKVSQSVIEGKDSDVSTVMDVIATHDRIRVVLYPYTRKGVATDFVVLVNTLSVVSDVKANIFTIRYVATPYYRFSAGSTYADSSPD